MKNFLDIEYSNGLMLDLYLPDTPQFDLFVFFHGGGLERGSHKKAQIFAKTLADNGIATASIQYSMYPTAKFPDFINDCANAVAWLKNNIDKYGKCNNVLVGGSSAGAYISMMLCFDNRYYQKAGVPDGFVTAYIHDAGQPTSHFNVLKEFGIDSRRVIVDQTAPIYFVGTAPEYPPMLFIVSDNDMFARYEQTMLMVKTLEHFGHKDKVFLQLMQGKHTEYVNKIDQDGNSVFAYIILKHLGNLTKKA